LEFPASVAANIPFRPRPYLDTTPIPRAKSNSYANPQMPYGQGSYFNPYSAMPHYQQQNYYMGQDYSQTSYPPQDYSQSSYMGQQYPNVPYSQTQTPSSNNEGYGQASKDYSQSSYMGQCYPNATWQKESSSNNEGYGQASKDYSQSSYMGQQYPNVPYSQTQTPSANNAAYGQAYGQAYPNANLNAEGFQNTYPTQTINVPSQFVGTLIGKAGRHINEMRRASRCEVEVVDLAPGVVAQERHFKITGPPHQIAIAVDMIGVKLDSEKKRIAKYGHN
jgi:hypothetical protein